MDRNVKRSIVLTSGRERPCPCLHVVRVNMSGGYKDSGRKLPPGLENQVDDLLLDVFAHVHPILYNAGATPNALTVASAILSIASLVALAADAFGTAAILYAIGYAFDVFDGNFARLYGMVSAHGDLFDHTKDIVVLIGLYAVVLLHPSIPLAWKLAFLVVSVALGVTTSVYFGCQEIYYHRSSGRVPKGSTFLSPFRSLCTAGPVDVEQRLTALRWVGSGTWTYVYCVFLVLLSGRGEKRRK